jgi:glycosidase
VKLLLQTVLLSFSMIVATRSSGASIILNGRDAVVWLPSQRISGSVDGASIQFIMLHCNGSIYKIPVNADRTFTADLTLHDKINKIWASARIGSALVRSVTLNFTMGYHQLPVVEPFAVVSGNQVILNVKPVDLISRRAVKYVWTAAKGNPAACRLNNGNTSRATVNIPAARGAYYFNLTVINGKDSASYKTYVTRNNDQLKAYDINKDHAAWIDSAIVYQVTPNAFVENANYDDITKKLPELRSLGINTIWLQPIYQTKQKGQGYDITDYFNLRADLGTERQLANLVAVAKKLNLRVIFDFVPNHTSINHRYAQECIKYGKSSHYYNFYQHINDGKPYSSVYQKDQYGFISYFWKALVNLDYNNKEVQEWMLQASKYWLQKYDIDGYRFDAMWGINARNPEFTKRWANELKSIKPDLLLLEEEKISSTVKNNFDAAYDWAPDTSWVSKWSWQTHHDPSKSFTVFNSADTLKRAGLLRKALFSNNNGHAICFRFIENNDIPRFINTHTTAQTELAAALLFSLPGLPMIYNGQEIGIKLHPYSSKPIFKRDSTIRSADSLHLFTYYQQLIKLRLQHPALLSSSLAEVPLIKNDYMLAFHRWQGNEHFIVILNMRGLAANAEIDIKGLSGLNLAGASTATDVLTDENFEIHPGTNLNIKIPLGAYGIRWLLLKKKA